MKRPRFILYAVLIFSFNSFSQDSTWKKIEVDENLVVLFPGSATTIDTSFKKDGKEMSFRFLKYESASSIVVLTVTPKETNSNVDNQESLKKILGEMAKGAEKAMSEKGMECETSDTTIDRLLCKKLKCQYGDFFYAENYIFLVNDKMYAFQFSFLNNELPGSSAPETDLLLNSIHFNKSSVKEQQFGTRAESIGYNIGRMIIPLLIIVAVIVFVVRKI